MLIQSCWAPVAPGQLPNHMLLRISCSHTWRAPLQYPSCLHTPPQGWMAICCRAGNDVYALRGIFNMLHLICMYYMHHVISWICFRVGEMYWNIDWSLDPYCFVIFFLSACFKSKKLFSHNDKVPLPVQRQPGDYRFAVNQVFSHK